MSGTLAAVASRVVVDPAIHHGAPVIAARGCRFRLSSGRWRKMTAEDVMREYELTREDIEAALAYAAELVAKTNVIPLSASAKNAGMYT
jgi:uncharacterized protein (DUF433 family)